MTENSEDQALEEIANEEAAAQPQPQPVKPQPLAENVTRAPQPAGQPVAASAEQGISAEIISGLVEQTEKMIAVLGNRAQTELKLQRAQMKMGEALNWLKQDLRAKQPAQG